jgi:hypothetical protein
MYIQGKVDKKNSLPKIQFKTKIVFDINRRKLIKNLCK